MTENTSYEKNTSKKRIALLDYWKAAAIVLVILTHYDWTSEQRMNPAFPFVVSMAIPVFMIISGYSLSMFCEKRYRTSLADCYTPEVLKSRFLRFTTPFLAAFAVELLAQAAWNAADPSRYLDLSLRGILQLYLIGGKGPGSYYYPIMIQLIAVFPLIYGMIRRNAKLGLLLTGAANLAYEVGVHSLGMPKAVYRLLIFRYLLLIAFGAYLFRQEKQENRGEQKHLSMLSWRHLPANAVRLPQAALFTAMMLLGIGYIVLTKYTAYREVLFTYWTATSMMTAFYIYPVFYWSYRHFRNLPSCWLQTIGQASYHIFLVQMLYYRYIVRSCGDLLPGGTAAQVLLHIGVCVTLGVCFYEEETRLRSLLHRWKRGRSCAAQQHRRKKRILFSPAK